MARPRPLTQEQIAVLRAAPIGLDIDWGNGDPHRSPHYRYQGADGRVARGLWDRELLFIARVGLDAESGFLLKRTGAGDEALRLAEAATP